ncbi:MAG: 16S rRNA (guanine(1405)-N(7))-methyltransferase RmtG [Clostridia bacterium]|nr:16S rRNA (guanine(1405)-N(7))-methyltransferase RmtG [Clostridia bacterium]
MKAGGQELFERLRASGRYGDLCPDALLRIAEECAGKYRRLKDAEGAARTALHGVTGSFMTRADEQRFLRALGTMGQCPDDRALEELLSCHASTRERLPLGEARALAERLLEKTAPGGAVLDLACGIFPVLVISMGRRVTGVDLSGRAAACVNAFANAMGDPSRTVCADLLTPGSLPEGSWDLVLMLKLLPLLDRQKKGSAESLLETVRGRTLIASFPTRTMSGRNVGMEGHYSEWMESHVPPSRRIRDRFILKNELFYCLEEV